MSTFLDHAATTPVREKALEAYLEALAHLGNPSSVHSHGRETRELLEQARELHGHFPAGEGHHSCSDRPVQLGERCSQKFG